LTHPPERTDLSSTNGQDRLRSSAIWQSSVPLRPRPTYEGRSVERGGATGRTYQLLCKCSYKVRCEIMRHGEQLGEVTFFDDEMASVTRGERIWYCPGCHSRLGLPSLRSRD
jgi:hypothetical protein